MTFPHDSSRRELRRICLCLVTGMLACTSSSENPASDAAASGPDATVDAALPAHDAAVSTPDAGSRLDASTPAADAGSTLDASTSLDAGMPRDAAVSSMDAAQHDAATDASVEHDASTPDACAGNCQPRGKWTTGDLHVHTIQSNDAQVPLTQVLKAALADNKLDWLTLSNHLRVSNRDQNGTDIVGGPVPESKGLALYEVPTIAALQAGGTYADKLIFSAAEWDAPTHDHIGIGIGTDHPGSAAALKALNQFEYLFTNRDPVMFDAADVQAWGSTRAYTTHQDCLAAIAWLKQNFPDTSYATINHPSRNPGKYTAKNFRELNDVAPEILFAIEGMVGNQMEPDRGGYASAYTPENAGSRTYGGVDAVVSKLGGLWDALLGEGRHVWNLSDSDFHFKTSQDNKFSSGYFPGEYAKNHVWVEEDGMAGVLAGLRAGKAFSVFGDLISALDFNVQGGGDRAEMGSELVVAKNSKVRITIRFKSEQPSHYENPVNSGSVAGALPKVDHVDLIAGDVGEKALPNTPGYDVASNASTHVVARFSAADWVTDAEGYSVVTHELDATNDMYFRLRGTNLGSDVAGETENGEPLADVKVEIDDNQQRFNAINDRNYADLWFYSNPIFVKVQ